MYHREPSVFRGVQGTAVVGVMGMTVAATGASEKTLKRVGIPYSKVRIILRQQRRAILYLIVVG